MKKTIIYLLFGVIFCTLCNSCLYDPYGGKYHYSSIQFYNIGMLMPNVQVQLLRDEPLNSNWDPSRYPMELWVDDESIATISPNGILSTKKKGVVHVYAKVESIYGLLEESLTIVVDEGIGHLTQEEQEVLKEAGLDLNNDGDITISELQQITIISDPIPDTIVSKIETHLTKLDSLYIVGHKQLVDVSRLNLKKLEIEQGNFRWDAAEVEIDTGSLVKEIQLCESIEVFTFCLLPGMSSMDFSAYPNLKKITRYPARYYPEECTFSIVPPKTIQYLDLWYTDLILSNAPYPELTKLSLENYRKDDLVITKEIMPSLTTFNFDHASHCNVDISDFNAGDFEYVYIYCNTLTIKKELYDTFHYPVITFLERSVVLK